MNNTIHYTLEPEVAGHLGTRTIRDNTAHPPVIKKLHYIFDGWLGDDIIEAFPVYLISDKLYQSMKQSNLTGYKIEKCEIEKSEIFTTMQAKAILPDFYWLQIIGKNNNSDFRLNKNNQLTVSKQAFSLLKKHNIRHCDIEQI